MTIEELVEEIKPLHNHIGILYDSHLVRILGVGEDEEDFYYVCGSTDKGRARFKTSAVGWLYSLKGLIPEVRYEVLNRHFEFNGCPKTSAFEVSLVA